MGTAQCCCDDNVTTKNEYKIERAGTPLEGRERVRSIKRAKEISVQTDTLAWPGQQQTFSPMSEDMFRSSNNFDTLSKGGQSNRQSYFNGVMQGHESRTYDNVFTYNDHLHPYGVYGDKRSFKSGQGQGGSPAMNHEVPNEYKMMRSVDVRKWVDD